MFCCYNFPVSGEATSRPSRAAGRARRRSSKENFLYIKDEYYNLLAKYFCIMRIAWAPKSFLAPLLSPIELFPLECAGRAAMDHCINEKKVFRIQPTQAHTQTPKHILNWFCLECYSDRLII
jgi:hypothetical protein